MERGGGGGNPGEEEKRRDETRQSVGLSISWLQKKRGTETLFGGLPSFLPFFFLFSLTKDEEVYWHYVFSSLNTWKCISIMQRESVGRDEKEGGRVLFLVEARQNLLNFSWYCFCECGCRFPGKLVCALLLLL